MKKFTGYKKSILFGIGFLFFIHVARAQQPAIAKQFFQQHDWPRAKESIDSFVKLYTTSAPGWMLKALVYNEIGKDAHLKDLTADGRATAFAALQKARQLDKVYADEQIMLDKFRLPFELYDGLTDEGLAYYNAGVERNDKNSFNEALNKFKKAAQVSQFIYSNGWGLTPTDTSNWFYIASTAINAGKEEDAFLFAKKIADAGISKSSGTATYESIYQWLVFYYKKQKDGDNLVKYAQLAMALFPASVYFDLILVDWQRQQQDYTKLFAAYEQLLKKQPGNTTYQLAYYNDLFNYLYNPASKVNDRPSYEDKLKQGLEHYLTTTPSSAGALLLLGKLYINLYNEKAKQDLIRYKTQNKVAGKYTTAQINLLQQSNKYLSKIIASLCQSDIESCKEAKQWHRYNLQRISVIRDAGRTK